MITEDYCSYEVAKLLKEKGFDEICTLAYEELNQFKVMMNWRVASGYLPCPTHQMAMKWLRENHIYICSVPAYSHGDGTWSWGCDIWADDNYEYTIREEETYEEAVEAALKYALKNLI